MPLSAIGQRILREMQKQYKSASKARRVFYAMENEGKLTPKAFVGGKRRKPKQAKRRK